MSHRCWHGGQRQLENVVQNAELLVLASHNMSTVRAWCDRAIKLEVGRIVDDGPVAQVTANL